MPSAAVICWMASASAGLTLCPCSRWAAATSLARLMVPAAVARYHLQGVNRGAVSLGFNDRVVVIFGFGPGSPEDQGEVAPCVCPNCHNL